MNIKNKTYIKLSDDLNYKSSIQKAMMSDNLTILLKIETTDIHFHNPEPFLPYSLHLTQFLLY